MFVNLCLHTSGAEFRAVTISADGRGGGETVMKNLGSYKIAAKISFMAMIGNIISLNIARLTLSSMIEADGMLPK